MPFLARHIEIDEIFESRVFCGWRGEYSRGFIAKSGQGVERLRLRFGQRCGAKVAESTKRCLHNASHQKGYGCRDEVNAQTEANEDDGCRPWAVTCKPSLTLSYPVLFVLKKFRIAISLCLHSKRFKGKLVARLLFPFASRGLR